MGGSVRRTSHTSAVLTKIRRAQRAGLIAGANVFKNAVKRGLRGGYTSGDFVTGRVLNSVISTEPKFEADGTGSIDVGTDLARMSEGGRDPYYPFYWELGHHNVFTRKYERVEIWCPAFNAEREAALAAYSRVFRRVMAASGGGESAHSEVDA